MKSYELYLFDFDYTLADASKGIVKCFQLILREHGFNEVTDEAIKHTIGMSLENAFAQLTGVADKELLFQYRKAYEQQANTFMTINTFYFPETVKVLKSLKANGKKIGIISTKYRYRIEEKIVQDFDSDFLSIIIGGEDVKEHKPSPEGLLFALEHLNIAPEQTLYIGDSEIDAQTAVAAGVDFVGILHGTTPHDILVQYPHIAISNTLEVLI